MPGRTCYIQHVALKIEGSHVYLVPADPADHNGFESGGCNCAASAEKLSDVSILQFGG